MTNADRSPFVARLIELRQGEGWVYMELDCRDPRVLRADPVLECLWDNPEADEAFDDPR